MSGQTDWSEAEIAHITSYRTRGPIRVDGHVDEIAWLKAPKSPRFVDMASGAPGFFDTRVATLWDDENFYVGFWIETPFVEARHTERDAIIFQENDVEVFIDGGDCYYEFEINALNTIYEILFVWRDAYTRGSRFDVPELDLLSRKAVTFGGDYDRRPESFWWGTHPRGLRWAFLDWDFPGVRSAVQIDGTINDSTDIDRGWFVEIAFPWAGMTWLADGRSLPPEDGDTWRMFFGRFEKLLAGGAEISPHPAWALNSHGVYDTHLPDRWSFVRFSETYVEDLVGHE